MSERSGRRLSLAVILLYAARLLATQNHVTVFEDEAMIVFVAGS